MGEVPGGLKLDQRTSAEPQCCCRQSQTHEPIPQQPIHVFSGEERRANQCHRDYSPLHSASNDRHSHWNLADSWILPNTIHCTINRTRQYSNPCYWIYVHAKLGSNIDYSKPTERTKINPDAPRTSNQFIDMKTNTASNPSNHQSHVDNLNQRNSKLAVQGMLA